MHIYSHLVVAQALLPHLQPASPAEYYWGAVAPDIRYAAGLRRRQTHRPAKEVRGWLNSSPELRDFVLGYMVHILTDERDAAGALYDRFPIPAVRRRLPRSLAAFLLESAYTESVFAHDQKQFHHGKEKHRPGGHPHLSRPRSDVPPRRKTPG